MDQDIRDALKERVEALARCGLHIGTSSWKYPGWRGQIYSPERYFWRNKLAEARFNRHCLEEYAETFSTVCVDAGYYKFPDEEYLGGLAEQVPSDFRFSFKVTDEITVKRFKKLPRFGERAGKPNGNFLNAELFQEKFLRPCQAHRQQIGMLIFEFSHFRSGDFQRGREFVEKLDSFFEKLPKGWQYGVEIRNKSLLREEYFATLKKHGAAHVYNQWTRMPPVVEQMAMPGSRTTDFYGARFLLTPGRKYEEAVESFSPYRETQAIDQSARAAGQALAQEARAGKTGADSGEPQPSYIYVNNRLEGNSLQTILNISS